MLLDKSFHSQYSAVGKWVRDLHNQIRPFAWQGIVIGGRVAGDVRIAHNYLRGVSQGITVGLSHRTSANQIIYKAGLVHITGNNVEISPPVGIRRNRYGIFVGNCDTLFVENNLLSVPSSRPRNLTIEGIRIFGHLGRMLAVRFNHLVNFSTGIRVEPLNPQSPAVWQVNFNMAPGALTVVNAPNSVDKTNNKK